jgi:heme exporter protein B
MTEVARVALAVTAKDLVSEWRSRELVWSLGQFILLALVIANFGFDVDAPSAGRIAPGVLWLALVFAGLVAFGRTFAAEKEQASLEAMLLTPAPPVAIFAGKAAAAVVLLAVCEAVLLPGLALFFGAPMVSLPVIAAVLLATVGMAVLGCLLAALAAQTRARELLLPVLALPLWIPLVVVGGQAVLSATGEQLNGQALGLLLDFDILFVVVASLAARYVLDE